MLLRPAHPNDDSAIGELLVDSFLKTYEKKMPEVVVTERRIKELRDVKSRREVAQMVVLESEGRVVGTACLNKWGTPGCEAWTEGAASLRMMALLPEFQGRSLSKQLVKECIRIAKELKAPALQLHIRRGAQGLARMYEAMGFERRPEGDLDLWPEIFLEAYEQKLS